MKILFESPRLLFRELNSNDASWFKELNDDPEVVKHTGDVSFTSIEEARQFLVNYNHYKEYGFGRWAVLLKNSGVPIGWCGLKWNEQEQIDLGFRIFQEQWNKGYATEAAIASLNFGFEELHIIQVIGRTSKYNFAGQKVLEKAGFDFWKQAPAHGIDHAFYYIKQNPFLNENHS